MDTDFIRWYWKEYKFQFVISSLLVLSFFVLLHLMGCSYKLDENTTVYGNCGSLFRYEANTESIIKFIEVKDAINKSENINCPTCQVCEVCEQRKSIENISPTPVYECETCPKCFMGFDEVVNKKLLNLKPGPNGNAAISHGYFLCKADVLKLVNVEGSKFYEGPAVMGYKDFYDSQGIHHPDNVTYCFRDIAGYFIVNRSIWGWNDSQCLSSSLKITKMD